MCSLPTGVCWLSKYHAQLHDSDTFDSGRQSYMVDGVTAMRCVVCNRTNVGLHLEGVPQASIEADPPETNREKRGKWSCVHLNNCADTWIALHARRIRRYWNSSRW